MSTATCSTIPSSHTKANGSGRFSPRLRPAIPRYPCGIRRWAMERTLSSRWRHTSAIRSISSRLSSMPSMPRCFYACCASCASTYRVWLSSDTCAPAATVRTRYYSDAFPTSFADGRQSPSTIPSSHTRSSSSRCCYGEPIGLSRSAGQRFSSSASRCSFSRTSTLATWPACSSFPIACTASTSTRMAGSSSGCAS